ncbi:hypothetical protein F7R21_05060 [Burkholderia latens]|uniref:Uncharacterized protein n=1 Tax=Burkholderia latens TaxID=488446 RepID=A0A6H9T465_9BURK|nr:hypothetical protein F7R21_05060 [Burkholderia latens]
MGIVVDPFCMSACRRGVVLACPIGAGPYEVREHMQRHVRVDLPAALVSALRKLVHEHRGFNMLFFILFRMTG